MKIDPVKNEFNTENVKTAENLNTKQDFNKEEDPQNTIKRVSLSQNKKIM